MLASSAKKVWDEFAERFHKSNLTRIYQLCKEITTHLQGMDSVTIYYSRLKDAWNELDLITPGPACDCEESKEYVEHLCNQRLLQFLMGLNESFSHVRSDILLRTLVLTINQAYAIVVQEESQRILGVTDSNRDSMSLLAGRGQMFRSKKFGIACEHCGAEDI